MSKKSGANAPLLAAEEDEVRAGVPVKMNAEKEVSFRRCGTLICGISGFKK